MRTLKDARQAVTSDISQIDTLETRSVRYSVGERHLLEGISQIDTLRHECTLLSR